MTDDVFGYYCYSILSNNQLGVNQSKLKERIEEGALGYNDAQQFVILQSGVPTYTITAFWLENGIFNDNLWKPLFVRTDK